jgi:hypothetical protein
MRFGTRFQTCGFRCRTIVLGCGVAITVALCASLIALRGPLRAAPADNVTSTIQIGGSRIDVVEEGSKLAVSHDELLSWVRMAAESVAAYYGHYPVPHVLLRVGSFDGRGVRGGRTFGTDEGGLIRIHVGNDTIAAGLQKDWMLTHEMVHLSFPSVPDEHHWIEEGIAVYVEPIARVQAGYMDPADMWFEVVRDMPQGLPEPGDEGLDHTHTWGRTYWGGALFCLVADVEIHRQTGNRKGLADALRAILDSGGNIREDWSVEKAFTTGDKAVGVSVLMPLYNKMKDRPYEVDLPAIWKELGIQRDGHTVHFVDSAPLAATRQAITFGAQNPGVKPASRSSSVVLGRTTAQR